MAPPLVRQSLLSLLAWIAWATVPLASAQKPTLPPTATPHVDAGLMALHATHRAALARGAAFQSPNPLLVLNPTTDKVLVRVTADDIAATLPALLTFGFEVKGSAPELHFVEGFLPIDALPSTETLGAAGGLGGVLAVLRPGAGAGLVTSQGDFMHETNRVRAAKPTGYDGTGVRVGVMSDSYNRLNGAATDISSGDLPTAGNITILQEGPTGSEDEGRAMMQIVHDLAPGSPLAFSSVFFGEADFAAQIRALARTANCPVLTDDIFYFAEPLFQDGVIAQAINDVASTNGVAYFSLAGNLASNGWETTTVTTGTDNFLAGTFVVFDPAATNKTRQRLTLTSGQQIIITMQWDNPFYTTNGVTSDLDLYILQTGTSTVLASSASNSITNKTPSETVYYTNSSGATQTVDLAILVRTGAAPSRIKWVNFGANSYGTITVVDAPRATPTIIAHSAAINGCSVGAVNFYDQLTPASFSSVGPSTLLFNVDGTRKATAEVRQTPQMAAIQGVDTTFFGSDIDGNGFKNFFGTSAAAPTAAAIGALIRQANPGLTPAQIFAAMESTATDIGAAGFDNVSGYGLLNAWRAIFGTPPAPASLPFITGFETGGLTAPWEVRDTVAGRLQVVSTNTPAAGSYHLTMDSCYNGQSSLNEATLHVDASGAAPVYLVFSEKEFSDTDNAMPASFTGSNSSDGVAFSVNGTTWTRVISLTGTASSNAYQTTQVNLSQLAAGVGVTLGADTRIKFQHYGSGLIANSGMAFDSIKVIRNAPAAPAVTSAAPPSATVGVPYSFTFTTSGNPPPTFAVTGTLPPGLALDPTTGTLSGTPNTPGVYPGIQLTATNDFAPNGTQTVTIQVNNTLGNYLNSWNLMGVNATVGGDPDGDGITNLLEYALNFPPIVPNPLPAAQWRDYMGGTYLSIIFTRVPLATDLSYFVETSTDLLQWSAVATSTGGAALTGPGVVSDDGSITSPHTVEVRDTVARGTTPDPRRFLRLRITTP